MKVLIINCGSSSLKYQLFDMPQGVPLAAGLVERIGDGLGRLKHTVAPGQPNTREHLTETPVPDHTAAMRLTLDLLVSAEAGVISHVREIDAVGHRVVHGGEFFSAPTLINTHVEDEIRAMAPLAPLHNPVNLVGIEVARAILPDIPHVAVFDTAFHQTMSPSAYIYGLPYDYYERLKVRRYGFHGTSHKYVAREAAKLLGKSPAQANLVTLHLGNGCSMAAVKAGQCVDTSMGMTPLAGVMMGTRCGDIDPAIFTYLAEQLDLSVRQVDAVLNKQSGLKGVCGLSDMRDIHAARADATTDAGKKAELAFRMFCRRIRHYLGAYMVELGRVDALVFTAGIGENDSDVRAQVCGELDHLGIVVDDTANKTRSRQARDIAAPQSRVRVLVVPTNEELEIANDTMAVVGLRS